MPKLIIGLWSRKRLSGLRFTNGFSQNWTDSLYVSGKGVIQAGLPNSAELPQSASDAVIAGLMDVGCHEREVVKDNLVLRVPANKASVVQFHEGLLGLVIGQICV
jgi:hypothetical protein